MTSPVELSPDRTHRRAGGRHARHVLRGAPMLAFPVLTRGIPVYNLIPDEAIELIHEESCRILEEIGIEFRDDEAIQIWKLAGAEISGPRVKIDRGMLMELVSKIPSKFTLHARNPLRSVTIGENQSMFIPAAGTPFVRDFDGTRRFATKNDLYNFHKLAYMMPQLHSTSSTICEPTDVPVSRRHLHVMYGCLRWSDKPFMASTAANREKAQDIMEMVALVFGREFVANNPVLTAVVNCNSPLVWDASMIDALKVFAKHNQPCLLSPFALAGASTPASTIGAVAQVNAEALAGLAFTQLVRPGSPQVYGQFMLPVDMKTGAPMGGTPEAAHMTLVMGQLVRRYKIPFRTSGFHVGSKLADAQAGYEANMLMHAAILSGAHYIWHVAGWLEAGLSISYSKFMLDCDSLGAWYKYAQGVNISDLKDSMAAVREVGPGGHFLGTAHTLANFESAFYAPSLMDFNSFEQWSAEGSKDASTKALEKAQSVLAQYEEPELEQSQHEALLEFIKRREPELPEFVS